MNTTAFVNAIRGLPAHWKPRFVVNSYFDCISLRFQRGRQLYDPFAAVYCQLVGHSRDNIYDWNGLAKALGIRKNVKDRLLDAIESGENGTAHLRLKLMDAMDRRAA
jgi:hypothetical protein